MKDVQGIQEVLKDQVQLKAFEEDFENLFGVSFKSFLLHSLKDHKGKGLDTATKIMRMWQMGFMHGAEAQINSYPEPDGAHTVPDGPVGMATPNKTVLGAAMSLDQTVWLTLYASSMASVDGITPAGAERMAQQFFPMAMKQMEGFDAAAETGKPS